jgi:YD repeat-containing protein
VAVPSLFTATSRTYKSPRGVFTTTLYGETVNVREAGGAWKPIGASRPAPTAPSGASAAAVTPNASVSTNASHDCALASNLPTTSICNATTDTVGYDGTNTDNSLVEFELKEALPAGANVLNAQLGMYLSSSSTKTAVSVSAYAATKAWTLSATWNTYDGTHAWTAPGGDFITTNTVANPAVTTPAGWAHWYPTQIVQEWVNGTLPNDGLLLADTTQKTTKDMLSFNSLDASSNHPYLTISWTPRGQEDPAVYTMQPLPLDESSTMKVNLASGDLFVNSNDLSFSGTGPPLLTEHNYDSLNTEGGSVNPWYSLPGASVYADGSVAIGINRYDYSPFIRQPSGSFLTPRGIEATLCAVNGTTCTANKADKSGATYALTFTSNGNGPLYAAGNKMTFSSTGGILSDEDTSGNAIVYHFGSKGIESISNTIEGRSFKRSFHKLKSGSEVTSAWRDATSGKEVTYAYNSSDQVETYTDAEGHKTKYAYDEEGELKEITTPAGAVVKLSYESSHRITKITGLEVNGLHPTWKYTYYGAGTAPSPCTAPQKATVVEETEGSEEPTLTYCANVLDEVESIGEQESSEMPIEPGEELEDPEEEGEPGIEGPHGLNTTGICAPSSAGYSAACIEATERSAPRAPAPEITSPHVNLRSPALVASYQIYIQHTSQYALWGTIRRNKQSYVLGNARNGWHFAKQEEHEAGGAADLGTIGTGYKGCGWVYADHIGSKNIGNEPSACEHTPGSANGSFEPKPSAFSSSLDCKSCAGGHPVKLEHGTPVCLNVSPLNKPESSTCNDVNPAKPSLAPTKSEEEGKTAPQVKWRYVTREGRWVLVQIAGLGIAEGSWAFVQRSALPKTLPIYSN